MGGNIDIPQNAFEKRNAKDIDLLMLDESDEKEEKEDECAISLKLTVKLLRMVKF